MREASALARKSLDQRLRQWHTPLSVPPRGWIRAIRESLRMSSTDLAARLGTTKQAVSQMERSEADGSIRISTLRRAADALNCRLVYALVPNEPLEETVDRRAHELASEQLGRIQQTMLLEDQAVARPAQDELLEQLANELKNSRGLWRS